MEKIWIRDNGSTVEFSNDKRPGFVCLSGDILEDARLSQVWDCEGLTDLLNCYAVCEQCFEHDTLDNGERCLRLSFKLIHIDDIEDESIRFFSVKLKQVVDTWGKEFLMNCNHMYFDVNLKCK